MQKRLQEVIDKCEAVIRLVNQAGSEVEEALQLTAQAVGEGMDAGEDASLAEALVALQLALDDDVVASANAVISEVNDALARHA